MSILNSNRRNSGEGHNAGERMREEKQTREGHCADEISIHGKDVGPHLKASMSIPLSAHPVEMQIVVQAAYKCPLAGVNRIKKNAVESLERKRAAT